MELPASRGEQLRVLEELREEQGDHEVLVGLLKHKIASLQDGYPGSLRELEHAQAEELEELRAHAQATEQKIQSYRARLPDEVPGLERELEQQAAELRVFAEEGARLQRQVQRLEQEQASAPAVSSSCRYASGVCPSGYAPQKAAQRASSRSGVANALPFG